MSGEPGMWWGVSVDPTSLVTTGDANVSTSEELAITAGCSPDERSAVGWAEVRSWALKHSTVACLPVKKTV